MRQGGLSSLTRNETPALGSESTVLSTALPWAPPGSALLSIYCAPGWGHPGALGPSWETGVK